MDSCLGRSYRGFVRAVPHGRWTSTGYALDTPSTEAAVSRTHVALRREHRIVVVIVVFVLSLVYDLVY